MLCTRALHTNLAHELCTRTPHLGCQAAGFAGRQQGQLLVECLTKPQSYGVMHIYYIFTFIIYLQFIINLHLIYIYVALLYCFIIIILLIIHCFIIYYMHLCYFSINYAVAIICCQFPFYLCCFHYTLPVFNTYLQCFVTYIFHHLCCFII